jgi:membrane-associated phospholipid phosphatase
VTSSTVSGPAALPVAWRRPAAWVAGLAALAVTAVGIRYAGLGSSTRTDHALSRAVETWVPERERDFWLVKSLGNPTTVVILAAMLAALAWSAGRRRLAALAVLGPGLTGIATTVLKPIFDRTLSGSPAYPSGHTAALTALTIVAALLLVSLLRASAVGGVLLIGSATVAAGAAMAIALIALGVHYPTDTIGGFGTAVAVVLGAAVVLDRALDGPGCGRHPTG